MKEHREKKSCKVPENRTHVATSPSAEHDSITGSKAMMEYLEEAYREVESSWLSDEDADCRQSRLMESQISRLSRSLRDLIRARSLAEGLSVAEDRKRVSEAAGFIQDLQSELQCEGVDGEGEFWRHREVSVYRLFQYNDPAYYDNQKFLIIESIAARYLARPWLQHDEIDWVLIDSLIFREMHLFSNRISLDLWWFRNVIRGDFIYQLLMCVWTAVFIGIPSVGIWWLFNAGYVLISYVLAIVLILYSTWALKGYRKRDTIQAGDLALLNEMREVYQWCRPPVINPTRLLERIDEANSKGVRFPAAVYSILQRVIERDPNALMPRICQ